MSTPAPTSQPVLDDQKRSPRASIERTVQYAAATSSRSMSASGLLKRNIMAATGVTASPAPASSPATGPAHRRTAAISSATAATPMSACGTNMDHELNPKIRPDNPITHMAAGGLSTVIEFCGSSDANSSAFQLCVPDCTAAA